MRGLKYALHLSLAHQDFEIHDFRFVRISGVRFLFIGITDDSPASKNRKSTAHRKKVNFKDEDDIINPEDIDPSVGKFRNLVQTQVIPSKRVRLHDNSLLDSESRLFGQGAAALRSQRDTGLRDPAVDGDGHRGASLYMSTPLMSSKLGRLRTSCLPEELPY